VRDELRGPEGEVPGAGRGDAAEALNDLLVIGGGITGCGIARDAACRGLKVAVIEAGDIGSGTSSLSSRLVHGGLRYLETFDFGLVFEALRERRRLLELAPHLVRPLPFLFPVFRGDPTGLAQARGGDVAVRGPLAPALSSPAQAITLRSSPRYARKGSSAARSITTPKWTMRG
jgi:glycerol-3-phosphate dehydrogenase